MDFAIWNLWKGNRESMDSKRVLEERTNLNSASNEIWGSVIYLCSCAANGQDPDLEKVSGLDMDVLFDAAQKHKLAATVGMVLERVNIRTDRFTKAIALAQRKNVLLDADRAKILAELEKAGIWYMPLKGSLLKDMYSRFGMRQMADNDILIDPERRADVRAVMEGLGFSTDVYDKKNHDEYFKPPVSRFEMHVYLINGRSNDELETYYLDIKDRLIKDEGNQYGYHFCDNDFYLFMVAHEYKHYVEGGTGLRSLLDTYVHLKQKEQDLDWDYIRQESLKMGIADFEQNNRKLAMHLFRQEELSEKEGQMLKYILSSGAYGTLSNDIENQTQKKGKLSYFFSRLILPVKDMRNFYPVLKRKPYLLPFFWGWRLVIMPIRNRKKALFELRSALGLVKDKKASNM